MSGSMKAMKVVVGAILSGQVTEGLMSLKLADGMLWPSATNDVLFVREYYEPLYLSVFKRFRRQRFIADNLHILTGQPGIGKSVFGSYLIYRLLTDPEHNGTRIAYLNESYNGDALILCRDGSVTRVQKVDVPADNMVVISDTEVHPDLVCPTVWISSPGALNKMQTPIKEALNRFPSTRLYMPLPDLEECLNMNRVAFQELKFTDQSVRARVSLWGPVPRLVFYPNSIMDQRCLANEVMSLRPDEIRKAFDCIHRSAGDGKNPAHRLFLERAAGQDKHLEADTRNEVLQQPEFYLRGSPTIASLPISIWLANAIKKVEGIEKINFLFWASGIGEHGARRGTVFESLALRLLERGGVFDVKRLAEKAGRVEKWSFPPLKRVKWDTRWKQRLDREAVPGTFLVPKTRRIQPGLDALIWVEHLGRHACLDCTVSSNHGMYEKDLRIVLHRLGWITPRGWQQCIVDDLSRMEVPYVWVTPEDKFPNWQSPQIAEKDSGDSNLHRHVVQYALKVRLEMLFEVVDKRAGEAAISDALNVIEAMDCLETTASDSESQEGEEEGGYGEGSPISNEQMSANSS